MDFIMVAKVNKFLEVHRPRFGSYLIKCGVLGDSVSPLAPELKKLLATAHQLFFFAKPRLLFPFLRELFGRTLVSTNFLYNAMNSSEIITFVLLTFQFIFELKLAFAHIGITNLLT